MWPQANVKRITIRQTLTPNKKATTNNRQTTKHYYKYVNTYTNAWMISSKNSNKKAKTRKTPTKSSLEKAKWLQASSSVAVDYLSFKCKLLFSSCVLFFFLPIYLFSPFLSTVTWLKCKWHHSEQLSVPPKCRCLTASVFIPTRNLYVKTYVFNIAYV